MHVGQLIKRIIDDKKMVYTKVAEELNMSSQNLHGLFKRQSTDISILVRISRVVGYDFLEHLKSETLSNEFNKDLDISVQEPLEPYNPPKNKIAIMVELDGTEASLNYWMSKLPTINGLVKTI